MTRALLFLIMFTLSFDIFLAMQLGDTTMRVTQALAIMLGMLLILKKLVIGKVRLIIYTPITFPLLILCGIAFFSTLNSYYPQKSLLYALWLLFNVIFLVFVPINVIGNNQSVAYWALKAYMVSFLLIGVFGLYQATAAIAGLSAPFIRSWIVEGALPRISGFSYEPSYYATYLILGFVLTGILLLERNAIIIPRKLAFLTHFILAIAILLSTSRAGIFVIFLYYTVMLGKYFAPILIGRIRISLLRQVIVISISFLAVTLPIWLIGFTDQFFGFFTDIQHTLLPTAFLPRWTGIVEAIRAFSSHPLLGVGIGGLGSYMISHDPTVTTSLLQMSESIWKITGTNITTEILAELGIVGFGTFLWFLYRYTKGMVRALTMMDTKLPIYGWIKGMLIAFVFEIIILQFNQNFLRQYIWFHIGLSMGVLQAYKSMFSLPQHTKNQQNHD